MIFLRVWSRLVVCVLLVGLPATSVAKGEYRTGISTHRGVARGASGFHPLVAAVEFSSHGSWKVNASFQSEGPQAGQVQSDSTSGTNAFSYSIQDLVHHHGTKATGAWSWHASEDFQSHAPDGTPDNGGMQCDQTAKHVATSHSGSAMDIANVGRVTRKGTRVDIPLGPVFVPEDHSGACTSSGNGGLGWASGTLFPETPSGFVVAHPVTKHTFRVPLSALHKHRIRLDYKTIKTFDCSDPMAGTCNARFTSEVSVLLNVTH